MKKEDWFYSKDDERFFGELRKRMKASPEIYRNVELEKKIAALERSSWKKKEIS